MIRDRDRRNARTRKGVRIKDWRDEYGKDPFSRPLPRFVRGVDALSGQRWFGGRKSANRRIPPASFLRASHSVPEAMVKLASWGSGRESAYAQFDYVTRQGDLEVEMHDGSVLQGREDIQDVVAEWAVDFHHRKDGKARNTVHFVVSAPPGSDRDRVMDAARNWAQDVFGENHAYGLIRHDDTEHPHVHVIAKVRGRDRSRFTVDRDDFQRLREHFAVRCREQDIEMNATPRDLRGARRGESLALRKMRDAGRPPEIDDFARRLVARDKNREGGREARLARSRRQSSLLSYAEDHRALGNAMQTAAALEGTDRAALEGQAAALFEFADYLEAGGEVGRPDLLRGAKTNNREGPMATEHPKYDDDAANAHYHTRKAEVIAGKMVEKLPEGPDRDKALYVAERLRAARVALDADRENTPLVSREDREPLTREERRRGNEVPNKDRGEQGLLRVKRDDKDRRTQAERERRDRDRDIDRE